MIEFQDYKELLDEIPDFVYFLDLKGNFLEVNVALKALLGYEKGEVLGRNVIDFVLPQYRQDFKKDYLQSVMSKGSAKGLMVVHDRSGKSHLFEFNSRLVLKNGIPVGVRGVARDVSAQKRLERRVAERELLYRTLFENATDGILLMEGEIFIDCNPKALEIFGCERTDLIKKSPYQFSPERQPDGRFSREMALEKINAVLSGTPQRFEWRLTRLDGTSFDTIVSLYCIEVQKKRMIVAMIHDISPLKEAIEALEESERRYRELVENANVVICRFATDGTFTFINRFGEEFFGYSREQLVGKRNVVGTIIPDAGEGSDKLKEMFRDLCAHPERYYESENKNITRDGKEVYISWRNQPIRDANGKIKEIMSIGADITKIRELEKELLQAKKLEAIGTLAGGIAHDFNNILGGIMGYLSLLKRQHDVHDEHYKILEKLESSAVRASDLVKQILAFSRRGKYESREVDVNERVQNVLDILEHSIPKKVLCQLHLEENLPVVMGDPSQIEQAIMNTCLNAIQAMPEGGVLRVRTTLKRAEALPENLFDGGKAETYIEISISDTGVGMDSSTRDHIFEPFFTTKSVGEGTGLGLSTVYGIIKNHQGGITVESEVGKGSTFKLYFPAAERLLKKEKQEPIGHFNETQAKGTILVVDDEGVFRDMLRDVLEYLGYRVFLAKDGKEGLDVFQEHKDEIDLVILDMNMPVMDGKELFRELKRIDPHIRALLSTGFALDQQVRGLMEEGVLGFIQKPFRIEEISTAIHNLLTLYP